MFRFEPTVTPAIVVFANLALVIPADPLRLLLVSQVIPEPDPLKVVADSVPLAELKVRFVPVLGARLPVALVVNTTLHEVSADSSATLMLLALVAVVAVVAVVALPLKVAVIVPAEKLPEPSLATMVDEVFELVALEVTVNVAAPDPLYV